MKALVLISLLFVCNMVSAQYIFKPIPKVMQSNRPFGIRAMATTQPDSTMNAIRPTATAAYAEPGNIAMAGVGLLFGFYNDLIRLGPIYNMNGKFGAALSVGVNFNN